jgi:hypothetical protein
MRQTGENSGTHEVGNNVWTAKTTYESCYDLYSSTYKVKIRNEKVTMGRTCRKLEGDYEYIHKTGEETFSEAYTSDGKII